jgi:hypothetical protein
MYRVTGLQSSYLVLWECSVYPRDVYTQPPVADSNVGNNHVRPRGLECQSTVTLETTFTSATNRPSTGSSSKALHELGLIERARVKRDLSRQQNSREIGILDDNPPLVCNSGLNIKTIKYLCNTLRRSTTSSSGSPACALVQTPSEDCSSRQAV